MVSVGCIVEEIYRQSPVKSPDIFVSENVLLQGESIQTSLLSIQIGKYENALLF